ncbi:MAG: hypothetical protein ABI725_04335 [Chloroflexota bacterium]
MGSNRIEELAAPAVPEANDFAELEGIGPRIHDILRDAGITTFAQLAATPVARIRQILANAEVKFPVSAPDTWPEQARLAAEFRWAELDQLKKTLKAGVRTGPPLER